MFMLLSSGAGSRAMAPAAPLLAMPPNYALHRRRPPFSVREQGGLALLAEVAAVQPRLRGKEEPEDCRAVVLCGNQTLGKGDFP